MPGDPAAVLTEEEPGNVQGWYCVGIVERSSGVNIRGILFSSKNLGYKTRESSCG